jgi:hypothetical protein
VDHRRFGEIRIGRVDEEARRLSHEEFAVASQLASEGHLVRAVSDRPGQTRVADLDVCGTPVEVKSWLSLSEREGHVPTSRSVFNKLVDASGQASACVLYAGASGLTFVAARDGVARFAGQDHRGRLHHVRVLGDGFDVAWTRSAEIGHARIPRQPQPAKPRMASTPELEL